MLDIEVVEVRGKCPVHKVGDKIVIDGTSIVLDKTDTFYMWTLRLSMLTRAPKVCTADFHVHLKYSRDSFISPKALIKVASKKGIDVVAITNHNTLRGSYEALKIAKDLRSEVLIIPGMEISTNLGHIIGLFLEENVCSKNFVDVVEQIKSQDGLVMIPHISKRLQNFGRAEFAKADLLEALNGRATRRENKLALSLVSRLNKPFVAGSDAHFLFELGKVLTFLPRKPADSDELRKMLLNGCISGVEGNIGYLAPYLTHMLSFLLETCRRLMRVANEIF